MGVNHLTVSMKDRGTSVEREAPVGNMLQNVQREDQIKVPVKCRVELLDSDIKVGRRSGVARQCLTCFADELKSESDGFEFSHINVDRPQESGEETYAASDLQHPHVGMDGGTDKAHRDANLADVGRDVVPSNSHLCSHRFGHGEGHAFEVDAIEIGIELRPQLICVQCQFLPRHPGVKLTERIVYWDVVPTQVVRNSQLLPAAVTSNGSVIVD